MNRFCPGCGRQLETGLRFCPGCGAAIEAPAPPAAAPAPAANAAPASVKRRWGRLVMVGLVVVLLCASGLFLLVVIGSSDSDQPAALKPGWALREGNDGALFAVIPPATKTASVKAIVLACLTVNERKTVHLQLFPEGEEPILPAGASREDLKEEPRAQIEIDGTTQPVNIYFSGDYAVVADRIENDVPMLSRSLADRIERGTRLVLRLDLVKDKPKTAAFDSEVVIDLKAGDSGAVAAVRKRCS